MMNFAFLSTAHTHTKGFLKDVAGRDNCRVAAIFDDMVERGKHYAEEYKAEFSDDLAATVARKDVDAFIVCAENTRHLPILEVAIPAGKPIFCEKPFTATTKDALKAAKLIRKHGTIVHMGYFLPFSDAMQGILAYLGEGKLGKLTHARFRNAHHAAYGHWFDSPELAWFYNPELAGGGAFMDMGTHAVHLVRTLFGPCQRVFATIGNASGIYSAVDDHGLALLQFANGVLCTVEASWIQTGGRGGLEVTGSAGTLYDEPGKGYVHGAPGKEALPVPKGKTLPSRVDRLIGAIQGTIRREEFDADLACAVDAVAIMEACYKSSKKGAWVDVPKAGL
jgi:predicted dehydrogenase